MDNTDKDLQVSPVDRLKKVLDIESVRQQFQNALGEHKNLFVASLIDLVSGDNKLQECDQNLVIREALKAATLKLPINKSFGFAFVIPYKERGVPVPSFQIGYKGIIQLAIRSGVYTIINADKAYEGELVGKEKLTGIIDLSGKRVSDKIIGYFAHIETVNGFKKTVYATVDEVTSHAKKYSKSYSFKSSGWQTDFDAMAIKTMLIKVLSKYGLMSVDLATGIQAAAEPDAFDYEENSNKEIIDIDPVSNEENDQTGKESEQDQGTTFGPPPPGY